MDFVPLIGGAIQIQTVPMRADSTGAKTRESGPTA